MLVACLRRGARRAPIWQPWLRSMKRLLFSAVPERRWAKAQRKLAEEGSLASKMVAGGSPAQKAGLLLAG